MVYRDKAGEIIFTNLKDLKSYCYKFIAFKDSYLKNEINRNENLQQLKAQCKKYTSEVKEQV